MSCSSRCIKLHDDNGVITAKGRGCNKLEVHDWLSDLPESNGETDIVEIRFKNTRKEFYQNVNSLQLKQGDIVAVEASPGHDIGIVSLTGGLVIEQLKRNGVDQKKTEFKKVYRKAKVSDIDKWKSSMELEHATMIKARNYALDLKLDMKIGDVEYQGDKTKAIFYYIADERVDFRELIKVLADQFKIRVEMRQIGARQEAGRIGGIGSCGREICCSSWVINFVSVTTNAARQQELSLNPQKLAGQCSKLKCCLNYELDCYLDARNGYPNTSICLETIEGSAYHHKTDIFKGVMWYSYDRDSTANLTPVPVERVLEIMKVNKKGEKVDKLVDIDYSEAPAIDYENVVGQESLTRFDKKSGPSRKKKRKKNKRFRSNRNPGENTK